MECIICFHKIRWYQKKALKCGHTFHRKCLKTWFLKQTICPICRMNVKTKNNPSKEKNKQIIMYAINSRD